jgi:phage terminase large subunit-like protein
MNILQAVRDEKVFAPFFRGSTWESWVVFLLALFALPMTEAQLEIYKQHTGRHTPPAAPHREAWLCIGRRGGKSFILACIAVFLACFRDWRKFLAPGEAGTVMIIAADRRQAPVIMRYCAGILQSVPMLKRQIENITRETVTLKNQIVIEVHTASFRTTRGYTIVAALLDEIAYWPTDENAFACKSGFFR